MTSYIAYFPNKIFISYFNFCDVDISFYRVVYYFHVFFGLARNAKSFRLETNHQEWNFFLCVKKYIYFTNVVSAKKKYYSSIYGKYYLGIFNVSTAAVN